MMKRIFSLLSLMGATLFAQIARAQGMCTLNGQQVPCDQLAESAKGFLGAGIAMFAVMFVVGIVGTIFWIMMIIHAATKPIENRAMWIIIMALTGVLGAIIYYFAVKRSFDKQIPPPSAAPTQGSVKS